jgi:hypothetical protein
MMIKINCMNAHLTGKHERAGGGDNGHSVIYYYKKGDTQLAWIISKIYTLKWKEKKTLPMTNDMKQHLRGQHFC